MQFRRENYFLRNPVIIFKRLEPELHHGILKRYSAITSNTLFVGAYISLKLIALRGSLFIENQSDIYCSKDVFIVNK